MTPSSNSLDHLRLLLREQLLPLITDDYVLLDCPYHANIGDTLIWEGELALLSESPHRMLAFASLSTWLFPPLRPGTVILLHGGGNFGDLWPGVQDFRLKVIEAYPNHPIIIFPQTVHYHNLQQMADDARRMAAHRHLTICARDRRSFNQLTCHFRNRILLLPDMAFCISSKRWSENLTQRKRTALWLKRTDQELATPKRPDGVPAEAIERDWPTLERRTWAIWCVYKLSGACDRLATQKWGQVLRRMLARLTDALAFGSLRTENIQIGIRFLRQYGPVYTTRLHGAILSLLLHKEEIVLLDNNYGKNASFYEAWLEDIPSVRMLDTPNESPEK